MIGVEWLSDEGRNTPKGTDEPTRGPGLRVQRAAVGLARVRDDDDDRNEPDHREQGDYGAEEAPARADSPGICTASLSGTRGSVALAQDASEYCVSPRKQRLAALSFNLSAPARQGKGRR